MIYSDRDIRRLLDEGRILIDPAPDLDVQLGSCSLDFRLGKEFRVFAGSVFDPYIDVRNPQQLERITVRHYVEEEGSFILHPNAFAIAATQEYLELPDDIVARLEGRSSLGRLGIIVHATASVIDPGWRGQIALELANHGAVPVALHPGMRICALTFEPLSTPTDQPYWRKAQAKYVDQRGPAASQISDDRPINE